MTNSTFTSGKIQKSSNLNQPLLEINDLVVDYPVSEGSIRAVDHVSLILHSGEVLGLVGESGCGKSTLGFAILRLLKGGIIREGQILYENRDLVQISDKEIRKLRGAELSMIFQASQNALNPLQKVSEHFIDTLKVHKKWNNNAWNDVLDLIRRLEIVETRLEDNPFQFSGGMQQRIVIALALLMHPKLIIADEPTTALDVLVQARTLKLFKDLIKDFDLTVILITHDLGVVAEVTQRVAIMYAAQILEVGDTFTIFTNPFHPYTQGLIAAIPNVKDETKRKLAFIPGHPPNLRDPPKGCRFADRCSYMVENCTKIEPKLVKLPSTDGGEHLVKCFKYDPKYAHLFE